MQVDLSQDDMEVEYIGSGRRSNHLFRMRGDSTAPTDVSEEKAQKHWHG
jgi:hypothetical protein